MSNCVVGSGGSRLPCSIIAEHSVEGCDHFSHDGDDDDLGFFVGGGKAFVEGAHCERFCTLSQWDVRELSDDPAEVVSVPFPRPRPTNLRDALR